MKATKSEILSKMYKTLTTSMFLNYIKDHDIDYITKICYSVVEEYLDSGLIKEENEN